MKRWLRGLGTLGSIAIIALLAGALAPAVAGQAATTSGWAAWQPLTGGAGSWTSAMQLPAKNFPAATITSDSLAGQVGVQSGANSWLSAATPPGAVYGSSRNQPYMLLKPRANNPTSPSVTSYTFDRPTPSTGWSFVVGDIDADRAVITATGDQGQALTGSDLGWQGGFNYCVAALSPSCVGDPSDIGVWDPATGELIGNATGNDTSGASGWFQPTVPLSTLTITFYQRTGFPSYQTWFASLARDISGQVVLLDGDGNPTSTVIPGATLTLFDAEGTLLETTVSGANGSYAFLGYTTTSGYSVELSQLPPPGPGFETGLVPFATPPTLSADLSTTDATQIDFGAQAKDPVSVAGSVRTSNGTVMPGTRVLLTKSDGTVAATTMTGTDGSYLFELVPPGQYTITTEPPTGYLVADPAGHSVRVADQYLTGLDFVLVRSGTIEGSITDNNGSPVPGVEVTVAGPSQAATVPSGSDGKYQLPPLPPGDYRVSITVPSGYEAQVTERFFTLSSAGDRLRGADFMLRIIPRPPSTLPATGRPLEPASMGLPLAAALLGLGSLAILIPRRHTRK